MNVVLKHAAKVFVYVITSAAAVSGLAEALEAAGSVKLANTLRTFNAVAIAVANALGYSVERTIKERRKNGDYTTDDPNSPEQVS